MYSLYHEIGTVRLYAATDKLKQNDTKIKDLDVESYDKRSLNLWFVLEGDICHNKPTPNPFTIVDDKIFTNAAAMYKWIRNKGLNFNESEVLYRVQHARIIRK
jgi:hypothetical protein